MHLSRNQSKKQYSAKKQWTPLEHKLYRRWSSEPHWPRGKLLLGWSGGLDSTFLAHAIHSLAPGLQLEIHLCTLHHGPGEWKIPRDRALKFCETLSEEMGWSWSFVQSDRELRSENELRTFRRAALQAEKERVGASAIVLAHHAQDLLETRLIRLFRGTGADGFPSMLQYREPILRPLLQMDRAEIQREMSALGRRWFEDPSNKDLRPQRNWIRNELLPFIQRRNSAWIPNLERSFQLIADRLESSIPEEKIKISVPNEQGHIFFQLRDFLCLSQVEREQFVAHSIKGLGLREFSSTHVKEILKYLDKAQREHTFEVACTLWSVNAGQVMLQKSHRV